ncbi:hypothetical protein EMIHUDRAFT_122408, partial [Emiliania huxleyi CCMP1516]|uniref:Uncharacterized protein n=2 Tax=Emiliania huxleyi TaxID=2903 RepID=A0A0D3KNJ1_EMIH1
DDYSLDSLAAYGTALKEHQATEASREGGLSAAHTAAHEYLAGLVASEQSRIRKAGGDERVDSAFLAKLEAAMEEHETKFDQARAPIKFPVSAEAMEKIISTKVEVIALTNALDACVNIAGRVCFLGLKDAFTFSAAVEMTYTHEASDVEEHEADHQAIVELIDAALASLDAKPAGAVIKSALVAHYVAFDRFEARSPGPSPLLTPLQRSTAPAPPAVPVHASRPAPSLAARRPSCRCKLLKTGTSLARICWGGITPPGMSRRGAEAQSRCDAAAARHGGESTIAGQSRGGVEGFSSSAGGAAAAHGHATRGGVAEGVEEALDEAWPRAGSSHSLGGAAAGGGGNSGSQDEGSEDEGSEDEGSEDEAASTRCWARAAAQVGVDGAVAAKRDRDRFGGGASDAVHDEGAGLVSVGGGGPPGMSRLGAEAQSRCEAAAATRGGGGTIAGQSRGGVEGHSSSAGGAVATHGHATRGGVAEGVDEALDEARPRAGSSRSRGGAAAGGGGESEVSRQSGCGGEGHAGSAAGSLASLEDATAGTAVAAAGGTAPPDEPRPWTAASTRCWARAAAQVGVDGGVAAKRDRDRFGGGASDAVHDEGAGLVSVGGGGPPGMSRLGAEAQSRCEAAAATRGGGGTIAGQSRGGVEGHSSSAGGAVATHGHATRGGVAEGVDEALGEARPRAGSSRSRGGAAAGGGGESEVSRQSGCGGEGHAGSAAGSLASLEDATAGTAVAAAGGTAPPDKPRLWTAASTRCWARAAAQVGVDGAVAAKRDRDRFGGGASDAVHDERAGLVSVGGGGPPGMSRLGAEAQSRCEAAAATRGGGGTIAGQSRGGVEGHSSSAGGAVATNGHATRGGVAEGVDEALGEARPRTMSSRCRGGAAAGGGGESEVSRQSGCGGEGHAGSAAGSLASLEDATAGTAVAAASGTAPPDEPRPWTAASTRCWARAAAQVGVDGAVAAKRDRDRFGGGASDAVHDEGAGLVSVAGGRPPGMSRLGAEAQSRCEAAAATRGGGGTIAGQSRGGVEGHSSSAGGAVATHGHATRGGVAEGVDEALDEARPRAGSSRSRGGAAAGGGGESEVSKQSGCGGEGHAGSAAGSLASLEDATAGTAVAAAGGTAPPDEPRPWTAASTRCWARAAAQVGVDGAVAARRDRDRFGGGASDAVHDEGAGLVSVGGSTPPDMSRLGAEAQSRCEAAAATRGGGGTIAGQSRGGVEGHSSSAGGAVATHGHATRGGVAEGVDEALDEARPRAGSSRSRGGAAAGGGGESEVSRQSGCGGEGHAGSAAGSLASLEDATAGTAVAAAGGTAPPDEPRPWTAASTRCWARAAAQVGVDGAVAAKRDRDRFGGGASDAVHDEGTGLVSVGGSTPPDMSRLGAEAQSRCEAAAATRGGGGTIAGQSRGGVEGHSSSAGGAVATHGHATRGGVAEGVDEALDEAQPRAGSSRSRGGAAAGGGGESE